MGAKVLAKCQWSELTHVVLGKPEGPEYAYAAQLRIPVLPTEWLKHSLARGFFVNTETETFRFRTIYDVSDDKDGYIDYLKQRIQNLEAVVNSLPVSKQGSSGKVSQEEPVAPTLVTTEAMTKKVLKRKHACDCNNIPPKKFAGVKRLKEYQKFSADELIDFRIQESERIEEDTKKRDYTYKVDGRSVKVESRRAKWPCEVGNRAPKTAIFVKEDAPPNVGLNMLVADALFLRSGGCGTVSQIASNLMRSQYIKHDLALENRKDYERTISDSLRGLKKEGLICRIKQVWFKSEK